MNIEATKERVEKFFELTPLATFPVPERAKKVRTIPANWTVQRAVEMLSQQKILAAPVVDNSQPASAPWEQRYIGSFIVPHLRK